MAPATRRNWHLRDIPRAVRVSPSLPTQWRTRATPAGGGLEFVATLVPGHFRKSPRRPTSATGRPPILGKDMVFKAELPNPGVCWGVPPCDTVWRRNISRVHSSNEIEGGPFSMPLGPAPLSVPDARMGSIPSLQRAPRARIGGPPSNEPLRGPISGKLPSPHGSRAIGRAACTGRSSFSASPEGPQRKDRGRGRSAPVKNRAACWASPIAESRLFSRAISAILPMNQPTKSLFELWGTITQHADTHEMQRIPGIIVENRTSGGTTTDIDIKEATSGSAHRREQSTFEYNPQWVPAGDRDSTSMEGEKPMTRELFLADA